MKVEPYKVRRRTHFQKINELGDIFNLRRFPVRDRFFPTDGDGRPDLDLAKAVFVRMFELMAHDLTEDDATFLLPERDWGALYIGNGADCGPSLVDDDVIFREPGRKIMPICWLNRERLWSLGGQGFRLILETGWTERISRRCASGHRYNT